jgi:hypothetical protein
VGSYGERGNIYSVKLNTFLKPNLDWEDEVNAIVGKCENPMNILNCVKNTCWAADSLIK